MTAPKPSEAALAMSEKIVRDVAAMLERSVLHHEIERDGWRPDDACHMELVKAQIVEAAAAIDADPGKCRLVEALRGMLLSMDAAWEQEPAGGHDWPEACEAARAALRDWQEQP